MLVSAVANTVPGLGVELQLTPSGLVAGIRCL